MLNFTFWIWKAFSGLNQIIFIFYHRAVEKSHQNRSQFELILKVNHEYKGMQLGRLHSFIFVSNRFTSKTSSAQQNPSFMTRWHNRCQSIFSLRPSNQTATFISRWHDGSRSIFSYYWMVFLTWTPYFWIILVTFPSFSVNLKKTSKLHSSLYQISSLLFTLNVAN